MLLTDQIEIQLQPLVRLSNLLYVMLSGCDWWISIRSVNNTQDWWKLWKRFRMRVFPIKIQFISRFYVRPSFFRFNIPFIQQWHSFFNLNFRFILSWHSFLSSTFVLLKRKFTELIVGLQLQWGVPSSSRPLYPTVISQSACSQNKKARPKFRRQIAISCYQNEHTVYSKIL